MTIIHKYVIIKTYGVSYDTITQYTRVSRTKGGGFSPVWNQKLKFALKVPQLAFVRFEVRDKLNENEIISELDDILLGCYTMRFSSIRPGLRIVPLLREDGSQIDKARIFVKITTSSDEINERDLTIH